MNNSFDETLLSGTTWLVRLSCLTPLFIAFQRCLFSFWKKKIFSDRKKKQKKKNPKTKKQKKTPNDAWSQLQTSTQGESFSEILLGCIWTPKEFICLFWKLKNNLFFSYVFRKLRSVFVFKVNWLRTCNCFIWRNPLLKHKARGVGKGHAVCPAELPLASVSLPPPQRGSGLRGWGHGGHLHTEQARR